MDDMKYYSSDPHLNRLLETVVNEVRLFAEDQIRRIRRLAQIGIALSAEKDINKLLEMIVDEAMEYTNADAGTLYTVDEQERCLRFRILKNRTLNIRMGGVSGTEIKLPPVPLELDGKPNLANVSSYCALKRKTVNIPDVYQAEGFDFTGPKKYDQQTGYRSRSMLVIPMENHESDVIGVLQLLNAKSPATGEIVPFEDKFIETIAALASQAAVALENAQLISELKTLFESFIESIATAIDEKSPYTAGHIRRVAELTMMIAHQINAATEGPFADISFSEDELEELRIAAWMHDVGKITTPEFVVDKSKKLETIFDRIELVKTRFELIRQLKEKAYLQTKLARLENGGGAQDTPEPAEERLRQEIASLEEEEAFIIECNQSRGYLQDDDLKRLKRIAAKTFELNGEQHPYLTEDELQNLSIRKGTLTPEERQVIENHALVSIKILKQLPFPKKLARVPEYAGGHHERLDGSGYPHGLTAKELPLQARIMAIADVFEALTAKDRPYKNPMKLSKAIQILNQMCKKNHIDRDIYDLFIKSGLYLDYAARELNKEQIDVMEDEA